MGPYLAWFAHRSHGRFIKYSAKVPAFSVGEDWYSGRQGKGERREKGSRSSFQGRADVDELQWSVRGRSWLKTDWN